MLIPLEVDRARTRPTLVVYVLVALNVLAFLLAELATVANPDAFAAAYVRLILWGESFRPHTLLTYAFLHAGFLHIAGNMLILWTFGPVVEDRLGRAGFLGLYLAGAVVAGLAHMGVYPGRPVVGASGAISAVTGAFLVLAPLTHVRCLSILVLATVSIPAAWFIGLAIAWDVILQGLGGGGRVARLAHLGGYALGAGVAMTLLWTRVLAREPFDLFSMAKQAHRRRQFRAAADERARAQARLTVRKADYDAEALAEARANVSQLVSANRLDEAGQAWARLVDDFAAAPPPATVLARRAHLDLANHLFAAQRWPVAATAYERFAQAYAGDAERPRVLLMSALIGLRHLGDQARARQALSAIRERFADPDLDALARQLQAELHAAVTAQTATPATPARPSASTLPPEYPAGGPSPDQPPTRAGSAD